jgi:hypothetical protein
MAGSDSSLDARINSTAIVLVVKDASQSAQLTSLDARVTSASAANTIKGARAFAFVDLSGTLVNAHNFASSTKTNTGIYALTLSSLMPDTNYLVLGTNYGNTGVFVSVSSKTSATIVYRTYDASAGTNVDNAAHIVVFDA